MTNYEMVRGESFPWRAEVEDNGSAVNLTGYKFYLTGKRAFNDDDADAIFALDSTSESTQFGTSSVASGIVDVTLLPANTQDITTRTVLQCEFGVKDSAGNVKIRKQFTLTVLPAVLVTMT